MNGSDTVNDDSERTVLRKTEKKYKLYYDSTSKSSKKKKQPRPVDLSEVIDFKSISESFARNGDIPTGVPKLEYRFDKSVFCLDNCPGFYFIPAALSIEEQCRWIKESLVSFPQPPNRTNHNTVYGGIHDLFNAEKNRQVLVKEDLVADDVIYDNHKCASSKELDSLINGYNCKPVSASFLLRKLRWSTLGLQFDWSKLAKKMAAPAMGVGEEFQPEAAIVNYFGSGDMLGGHLDDMEADWSKPIVSISLGCKAIFLLGGKSRNDELLAMFLRSGDIVLMSGQARDHFHEIGCLEKQLSEGS